MDIKFYDEHTGEINKRFYDEHTGEINESGEKWLETEDGKYFLFNQINRLQNLRENWLITEAAIYWLAFKDSGKKWLETEHGKEYLEYLESTNYLESSSNNKLKNIIIEKNNKIDLIEKMNLKIIIFNILNERQNIIKKAIQYQKDYKQQEERKYKERKEKERQKLEEEEKIEMQKKENQQKDYYFFNEIEKYELNHHKVFDNTQPNKLPDYLQKLRKEYLERHENDPKEEEITWVEFGRNMFDSGTEVLNKCFGIKCKKKKKGGKQNTNKNRKNKSKKIRKRHMKSRRNKKANM